MKSDVRGSEKISTNDNTVITEDNGLDQEHICKAIKKLRKKM